VKANRKLALFMAMVFMLTMAVSGCASKQAQEAQPAAAEEIKIGANLELSGDVASYGKSALNGFELALEEINKTGVLGGKKLKLVTGDNKSDNAESLNIATKLVAQDKVVAILGPLTTGNTLAAVPAVTQAKVPLMTIGGTNPKVTVDESGKTRDYIFRVCFIDPFQGVVGAKFAATSLNAKKAAIYFDNGTDYSKELARIFEENFVKLGGQIVAKESYVKTDTDFKATLTKIKKQNPDLLYIPGYYENVGLIVKQARELGINIPMLGGDGWDSPKLAEIAGAQNLNNTYFTNHYSSQDTDPAVVAFNAAYKAKYNAEPDGFAALGYDAMKLLADAINRAGAADPEKIKDALAATKDFKAVTGTLTMDAQHNPVKAAVIIEMKDGKQTFREKVQP